MVNKTASFLSVERWRERGEHFIPTFIAVYRAPLKDQAQSNRDFMCNPERQALLSVSYG